jgi:tRNA 2-thiouridine synthesizing protein D
MKLGVMVLEGPYQHQAADSAYHFLKAAQARGHEITGIFLYTDGVNVANRFIKPPGERSLAEMYDELAKTGIKVVACTACAKFRGMKRDLAVDSVSLSGLGELAEMLQNSDRFVTFGD